MMAEATDTPNGPWWRRRVAGVYCEATRLEVDCRCTLV